MNENLTLFLLIFLSVDAIALLFLLWYFLRREARRKKVLHFGDRAEESVAAYIREEFPGAVLFNDVYLTMPNGNTTQIDHILLCKWGVFVIETKSHNGTINDRKKDWVQIYKDKVVYFHSPVLQNEAHQKALTRILKQNRQTRNFEVKGVVVFTSGHVHFSKKIPGVIRLGELGSYIKNGVRRTPRGAVLTAKPGRKYLTRSHINALEKQIRRCRDKNPSRRKRHDKAMRGQYRTVL